MGGCPHEAVSSDNIAIKAIRAHPVERRGVCRVYAYADLQAAVGIAAPVAADLKLPRFSRCGTLEPRYCKTD